MANNEKFLVAGEHFYQPPRQASHSRLEHLTENQTDWNTIIAEQCYIPQIENGTLDLASFDFFSTIRQEMNEIAPEQAELLRAAMRERGVGDPFLHVLLPDLSREDKKILITAGFNNFANDVGVNPQWFWAPETALDNETLEVLVEVGYQGVLCAPEQIYDTGGEADNHPIIINLDNGESITALPFDRPISSSLAFANKGNADEYTRSIIIPKIMQLPSSLPLIFWTDGETFGHHDRFAHLFLDYLLKTSLPSNGVEIASINDLQDIWQETDYRSGKLNQRSAWSCPHGNLVRWHGACPCDEGLDGNWKRYFSEGLKHLNQQITDILNQNLDDGWEDELAENFVEHFYHKGFSSDKSIDMETSLLAAKASALAAQISCGTFFNNPGTSGKINLLFARQSLENLIDAGYEKEAEEIKAELLATLAKGIDPSNGKNLAESLAGIID